MRNLSRLFVVLVAFVVALVAFSSVALAASRLVYSDECNGPLDASTWSNDTPWNTHYTTGELEYYDPGNCTFSSGVMTLKSENRSTNGYSYASAIVTSLKRAKFSYGYFEIRAKLPKGPGIWPAFWLTNDSTLEIDGLEMLGDRPTRIYQTLHENNSQIYQGIKDGPDYSAGYHTYAIDWQPTYCRWYIDGALITDYEHAMPSDPLYICLNTAVGGAWPGPPTSATSFPVTYDIDYVRVYDSKPAANTAPATVADSYSASGNGALSVSAPGLLGNDSDAEGDSLTASIVAQPSHGTVSLSANGAFTYTPASGFWGVDSFTYRAYDGREYSPATTCAIVVPARGVPAPHAAGEDYTTIGETTLYVPAAGVLANDSAEGGRQLHALTVTAAAHGSLVLGDDGSFAYIPAAGFAGADSFSYVVSDGSTVSSIATVSLTVIAPTVPTVVATPQVKRTSRVRRTYRVSGTVRLGRRAQSESASSPSGSVVLHVYVQRYAKGTWRGYRTATLTTASASKYATLVRVSTGLFRVRTSVSGGGAPSATSAWSASFRVR